MSNPVLPEDVFQTLVEVCNRHPGPVQDDRLFGDILNEVAWRHRHQGFGLSRKTGGRHVDSPVGPIAEDVLMRTDGHHWDVLGAAAVGNPLRPGRSQSIGIMTDPNRPFVPPVEPAGGHVPAPPVSPPASTPLPPSTDLSAIKAQLAGIRDVLQILVSSAATQGAAIEGVRADLHHFVGHEILPHIDDTKRLVVGLPREERFR